MASIPSLHMAKQTTAQYMRETLPKIDASRQILTCRACCKATVPVPDPQRQAPISHCYRCGCEHATCVCEGCGVAIYVDSAAGEHQRCDSCRKKSLKR